MPEIKFELKGPVGVIIGLVIVGGVIYFQFFMPFSATAENAVKITGVK